MFRLQFCLGVEIDSLAEKKGDGDLLIIIVKYRQWVW